MARPRSRAQLFTMTVVIWDFLDADIKFFVTHEPVCDLDRKYINSVECSDDDSARINNLVYDEEGNCKVEMTNKFPVEAVRDGAAVVVIGFLP